MKSSGWSIFCFGGIPLVSQLLTACDVTPQIFATATVPPSLWISSRSSIKITCCDHFCRDCTLFVSFSVIFCVCLM